MGTKHILICFIGLVLLFACEGDISDQRLCGDPTCSEPVSYATTLLTYSSDDARILSFPANAKVKVFSKSAGTRDDLWGIEINGRRGYAPKAFLRENRILKSKLEHRVLTETEDEYDLATSDDIQPAQETQVVDGTTFFLDQSASSADQTESLNLPGSPTEATGQVNTLNPTEPSTVPSQADTVMPNLVESKPPIHSTEIPNIPDPSLSTQVPSIPNSEAFSESTSVPSPDVSKLVSTDSNLGLVENPTQNTPASADLLNPPPLNAPSDHIEATLIQVEAPVQPITTGHVEVPLDPANPILNNPDLPSPVAIPALAAHSEDASSSGALHEDDEDDDDYFEEEEGSTRGIYQYISSFMPGDASAVKEEPTPEVTGDTSSKESDSLTEILRKESELEFSDIKTDVPSEADKQNDSPPEADIKNIESYSDSIDKSVLIGASTVSPDSPTLGETTSSTIEPPILDETLTTFTASSVTDDSLSEKGDFSAPLEMTTEAVKVDEWAVEQSLEGSYRESTPLPELVTISPDELIHDKVVPNEMVPQEDVPQEEVPNKVPPSEVPPSEVPPSEVPPSEVPSSAVFVETDDNTNETQELPRDESVGENLPFFQQPSIIPTDENLHELNEEISEDLSPSFFSLVSNYLSGLSNPFAKSDSDSVLEDVDVYTEPVSQETCSAENAARNCDSEASVPVESAYDYPYEMGSTKGILEETDSAKLYYLIITAVTVLLFTLGHYFIEKLRQDAKYVSTISNLQKQLMISAAEVSCARDELEAFQNSEMVAKNENAESAELTEKLAESQNACADLEEQIACLQSELETATETGLELNRMLSEYLATQHNSENDPLKSKVEDLQIQLNSQHGTIVSMSELLAAKDSEIEGLIEELMTVRAEAHELTVIRQKLSDLTEQATAREASLTQLKHDLVVRDKEMSVAQECITKMNASSPDQEDFDVLRDILDVAKVLADLQIVTDERDLLRSQFEEEVNTRKMLEDHRSVIEEQIVMLQEACRVAISEKTAAKTKLDVLSDYYKEKEDQHQKELVTKEATCLRQASELTGDEIASLQEQITNYRTQNETLKREILDQERDFKDQIASLELKVHENWVAARQAERRSDELKQDAATLRNLLTIAEKQSTKQMGDRLPSPLHAVMPDCPPVAVMPPCLFPAPGSPHDRRPPPLGCMSSPPLLPAARYHHGFRPLSAPKGSNHSSGHSSGSIEKYNNQV